MICTECAYEADRVKAGKGTHLDFKNINEAWIAFGAGHAPMGHAACKGGTHCDCHHKDVTVAGGPPPLAIEGWDGVIRP